MRGDESISESLLVPSFEQAFWRSRQRLRYRDFTSFTKKKGHFEPDEANAYANRFAEELTREESAAEIRQIYENAVIILGNRRSSMDRSDRSLDCPQLRFTIEAGQDSDDPSRVLVTRSLWIKTPLNELPPHFDDLFPYPPEELVVPIMGTLDRREILVALEDWEIALKGRLSENASQTVYQLRLPSGFAMAVDLNARETCFAEDGISGVLSLAASVARDLKSLRIRAPLL